LIELIYQAYLNEKPKEKTHMFNQMKQLYEMQKKAKEIQRQLEGIKIEKTNKNLTAKVNATQKVESLTIDSSYLTPDKKNDLEQTLVKLINEALEEAQKKSASQAAEMMKGLQGLNIPGL